MDSWQWLSTSSWFSVTDSCILSQCRADSLWICVMFGHGKSVLRKLGQPDKRCICCKSRMSCGIRSYNKCSKCCHRPWHSPTIVLPLIYYPVMICCLKSGQTSAVSDVSEVYGEKCFAEHCITLSFAKTTVLNLCSRPKKPNENKVMLPVLTAGRQSRRLRRPTNKPENCGSSIFHRRTESMEPAADWTEKNTINICLSLRTENISFQLCILLWITWYNDYVMHPQSYSRGLRNRKTYANANAKKICSICPYRCN